ncbi:Uncharacterised protein [Mycobacterium tuberculosis]|nr:Uncharacterised protein [Mycobacterium tuberculosis]
MELLTAEISDTPTFVCWGLASGNRYSCTSLRLARLIVTMRVIGTDRARPARPGVCRADCMMPTNVVPSGVIVSPSMP